MLTAIVALSLGMAAYDPMTIGTGTPKIVDETWTDAARKRDIPVRIYRPAGGGKHPVVLFSHGLGGARTNNKYIGEHLARRGYTVVFLQHIGSDESVWKGLPPREVMPAMKKAASAENVKLRAEDVKFVLDRLETGPETKGQPMGISGHSFGALTSQIAGGMSLPVVRDAWSDSRIQAAVMYSPNLTPGQSVSGVKIPWLLMTGTRDDSIVNTTKPEDRLKVFPALPKGDKYELVFEDGDHMAFSDVNLAGRQSNRNPNHHRAILALTTAFFDAYLKKDATAKNWLQGKGPRSFLEPKDRWQTK